MRCLRNYILVLIILFAGYAKAKPPVKDLFEYGGRLIKYIASEEFSALRKNHSKIELLDSIFKYSLQIAEEDIGDALLFCSIGTLTYSDFDMVLPFIGSGIKVYIFNQLDTIEYKKMINNLPRKLFDDSPDDDYGDLDKITHFFSAAFLSYQFNEYIAENIGVWVEYFEEGFKAQSKIDERDLRVNKLGIEFGKHLKKEKIFPSNYLNKTKSLKDG